MPLDMNRLNKLAGKKKFQDPVLLNYDIDNTIDRVACICLFFNGFIEFFCGIAGLIYIASKDVGLSMLCLGIILLSPILSAVWAFIQLLANFIGMPLSAINKPLFLLPRLLVDSIVCWFVSVMVLGYIHTRLQTNTLTAFIFSVVISTVITKLIFLAESYDKKTRLQAREDEIVDMTLNYSIIFSSSLYLANILSIATLLFGIKGLLSLGIYLAVLLLPALIYIITECIKPRIERN